jgi:hypothetical protein
MRKAVVLGVLGLAGTLASPAFADDFSGVRLGLQLSSDKLESDYFEGPVAATTPTDQTSSNRFGYGFFGGWALNKYLAFEGGLVGGTEYSADIFPEAVPDGFYDVQRVDLWGGEVSVVGSFWIGKRFSIFGRAGMFGYKSEVSESFGDSEDPSSKTVAKVEGDGFEPLFGIGVQTVLDGALVRLEYKQTSIGDHRFFDNQGTAATGDDIEYNWRNSDISSLTFSIVWILK